MSIGSVVATLIGTSVGILVIDQILKSRAPAPTPTPTPGLPVWTQVDATQATTPGKWYRWSLVGVDATKSQAAFGPEFSQLKVWPTISIPADWPVSDEAVNRVRFEGMALSSVIFPAGSQPVVFELTGGSV